MPLFDYQCKKCGNSEKDVLVTNAEDIVKCKLCGEDMEKLPSAFSFTFTPGPISKFKRKYGNTVPPEYKTGGSVNIYK